MGMSEDEARRKLVEARNQGEALLHQAEKQLAEFGEKLEAGDRTAIETAISELKGVIESEDGSRWISEGLVVRTD